MKNYSNSESYTSLDSSELKRPFTIASILFRFKVLFATLVNYLTIMPSKKVVIVGANSFGLKLQQYFTSYKKSGYKLKGIFDLETPNNPYQNHVQGGIEELKKLCLQEEIDEIYFARPLTDQALIKELQNFADKNFIYFRMAGNLAKVVRAENQNVSAYYFDDIPIIAPRKEPLASRFNQITKRAFDIVFSLCALAFLVPFVFPFIAIAIKWESKGSIFFIQKRPGKKNKLFGCFKFRSMTTNGNTEQQAKKNDARITKVGAFLRKTSLDELPQFINVLLGDMSVVGPRPNMVKQLEHYSQVIDNYAFRHFVTPGITGYAQVNGFRGETQTVDLMKKRVEYDIEYMKKWSLWFDIKIIFLTVWNMVKGEENAY